MRLTLYVSLSRLAQGSTRRSEGIVRLPHPKEPGPAPLRSRDGAGDAGEAVVGAPVPEKSIGHYGHSMSSALPLAHQDGAGPGELRWLAVALVRTALGAGAVLPTRPARSRERPIEQPVKLARHRFWKPAVVALLPRMRDGERKQITPERRWRLCAELLPPQVAKLGSRESVQIPKIAIRSTSRRHRALLLPHARSHSPKTPVRNGCSPPHKQLQVARA